MKTNQLLIRKWSFLMITLCLSVSLTAQTDNPEKLKKESNRYINEAKDALSDNDYASAEAAYRKAIAKDPSNTDARYNMGNLYYGKENSVSAEQRLKQAAEIAGSKDEKHRIFHNLGNSFMQQKDYASAVEAYKNALRANPSDDETRYNLALAKQKQENEQQNQKDDQNDDGGQDNEENQDQQNQQDQQEQNKDGEGGDQQNQDQKPEDEGENEQDKKDGDQNEDKQEDEGKGDQEKQEQGDEQKQQQQRPVAGQLSPQQIQNLLEAMNNEEKKVQDKMNEKKAKAVQVKTEKDW